MEGKKLISTNEKAAMFFKNEVSGVEGSNSGKPVLRKRLDLSPQATCIDVNYFNFYGSEVRISHPNSGRDKRAPNILSSPPPTHAKAEEKSLCCQFSFAHK